MATGMKGRPFKYVLPSPPIIHIHDPTSGAAIVRQLVKLIPNSRYVSIDLNAPQKMGPFETKTSDTARPQVVIFADCQPNGTDLSKKTEANRIRQAAVVKVCNFASVNLYFDDNTETSSWTSNHLNSIVDGTVDNINDLEIQNQADKIYKWLFKTFTVKDTLHLLSDETMRTIDKNTKFPDFIYCPLSNSTKVPKDAKVQFVVLIVSKPEVVFKNRITWQAADKTGVANFYYKWRGPSSQKTWDWVLALQPGELRCLPRMPCILLKEKLGTQIIKAPFRLTGSVVKATGTTIKSVGSCVRHVGKAMQMGESSKWVLQADVEAELKKNKRFKIFQQMKKEPISVGVEKSEKPWSDKDSDHSTLWNEDSKEKTLDEKEDLIKGGS